VSRELAACPLNIRTSAAIRGRMSQISWRTTVARQSTN
jgi:hypothetical protein